MMNITLAQAIEKLPLVAILRGVNADDVVAIGQVLVDTGFSIIEVPLNSPEPYASIRLLSAHFSNEAVIGAGTVHTVDQVNSVHDAGGRIIVMPHVDKKVISCAKSLGLYTVPGFFTPSEAYAAINLGVDALKLFPAEIAGSAGLAAMRAILPAVPIFPVGGISADNMAQFLKAGANGFGLGSGLYKPGMSAEEVRVQAEKYRNAYNRVSLVSR